MALIQLAATDETLVQAACAPSDVVGEFVCFTGELGGLPVVEPADPEDEARMPAGGIIESKPTATTCMVRTGGYYDAGGGLTPGARYFVGLDALPTSTPPSAGAWTGVRLVQLAALAVDARRLLLLASGAVVRVRA